MALGRLTALQERVLVALGGLEPPWTLTGGGALAGFHTRHRVTRDLDLFFRGLKTLGTAIADVQLALETAGMDVAVLRSTPMFSQLEVRSDGEVLIIDLVADPTPIAEAPQPMSVGTVTILVETPHQLLVNKLCALLSRSELRDLVDVKVLVESGQDLVRALRDSPDQDAGFSPLTFAWCVRGLELFSLGRALGWPDVEIEELDRFREQLIARVLAEARP